MAISTLVFVVCAGFTSLLGKWVYHNCVRPFSNLNFQAGVLSIVLSYLTAAMMLMSIILWLFMCYYTASAWYISLDSSRPKPLFLIVWLLNVVLLQIGVHASRVLGRLSMRWSSKH